MARKPLYVAAAVADKFAVWCLAAGVEPTKTVEEVIALLITQPTHETTPKPAEGRKPWERPPFYGQALTEKWSRDQELLARLKVVRELFAETDQAEPLARALQVEVQRLERILNLSSVRYRGDGV